MTDDSWLNLSPENLQEILSSKMSAGGAEIAGTMNNFMDKRASHEGVDFPDESDGDIKFGAGGFIHAMQKMFEFDDHSSSSSDMSEYGSDDENDLDTVISSSTGRRHRPKSKDAAKLQEYMDQMDRELATTNIGKSFEREPRSSAPTAPPRKKNKSKGNAPVAATEDIDDIDDIDDDFRPVDVDANLVRNMLESQRSQQGNPGPATNILRSMTSNKENYGPKK